MVSSCRGTDKTSPVPWPKAGLDAQSRDWVGSFHSPVKSRAGESRVIVSTFAPPQLQRDFARDLVFSFWFILRSAFALNFRLRVGFHDCSNVFISSIVLCKQAEEVF
jgi:hypothetical protein